MLVGGWLFCWSAGRSVGRSIGEPAGGTTGRMRLIVSLPLLGALFVVVAAVAAVAAPKAIK